MIAQTFFLLSVSDKLKDHLTIHFGRPSMRKYLDNLLPDEVYFCGGQSFKESVRMICFEKRIPFYSESFDSADLSLIKQITTAVKRSWKNAARSQRSFSSRGGRKRYNSVSTRTRYSHVPSLERHHHPPLEEQDHPPRVRTITDKRRDMLGRHQRAASKILTDIVETYK
jgi:hypothetical protein